MEMDKETQAVGNFLISATIMALLVVGAFLVKVRADCRGARALERIAHALDDR